MGLNPRFWLALTFIFVASIAMPFFRPVSAAPLGDTYVRFDRMKTGDASSVRVVFKVSTAAASGGKVKLTFADGTTQTTGNSYTVATSGQSIATAACATETGATALPTSGVFGFASSNTNNDKYITVSSVGALTATTTYCFDLNYSAATNPAAGPYSLKFATQTSADADIDTKYVGARVVGDDQIVVTAIVPPSFDFVLSGNTDAFTALLDKDAITNTTGRTVTITTNAAKGWIAWVKSANQGLSSASAPYTIASGAYTENNAVDTITTNTEGYILDVDLTTDPGGDGGTVTVDGDYNGSAAGEGGRLSSVFRTIASSTGTSSGSVITLIEKATISAITPAANDYTDTLTVVGAGNF